MNKLKKKTTEG